MYKILKMNNILTVGNRVYRVDYDVVFESETRPGDEIIDWFKSTDYEDDSYLICEYDGDGVYKATVGVVYYNKDETEVESFVDCAEHDYRVYGDVANNPVSDKYLYKDIIDCIKNLGLVTEVIELINEKFYEQL